MPRHRHRVDSTTATIPAHTHTLNGMGAYTNNTGVIHAGGVNGNSYTLRTSSAGGGSTGAIAPYVSYTGNGTAFNNMPPYLTVNIWKRLT